LRERPTEAHFQLRSQTARHCYNIKIEETRMESYLLRNASKLPSKDIFCFQRLGAVKSYCVMCDFLPKCAETRVIFSHSHEKYLLRSKKIQEKQYNTSNYCFPLCISPSSLARVYDNFPFLLSKSSISKTGNPELQ
jgi:hypothetical protein